MGQEACSIIIIVYNVGSADSELQTKPYSYK